MHALRYEGPTRGVVLGRDRPDPIPREGEALIRTLRAAVSHSDAEFERSRPDAPPITLGRQFVGIVEAIGGAAGRNKAATALVGKRVVGSINCPCGACERCRGGLSAHCATRQVLGLIGRDGCLADRFTLPVTNLIALPAEVDDDHAVFAEPVAAALHASQQLRIEGKPYVTVLGDGVMGLLCAQIMTRRNASVRVLGRSERKLEVAAKWGIKHRLEHEAGRRADQDIVIDCTGTPEGLMLALQMVRPRGKVLYKGPMLMPGARGKNTSHPGRDALFDPTPIAMHEIEVIGSRCGTLAEAVAALARAEVEVLPLIGGRDRLDRGVEAVRQAARGEVIAVVIEI